MTRKLIPILLLILLSGTSALLADAARKPKGGIIVMEAELFDDLSLIHISEPTRPY